MKTVAISGHDGTVRQFRLSFFKCVCLVSVVLSAGCSTTDTYSAADTPWNRETKAEVFRPSWFFWPFGHYDPGFQDWDRPGNHYP